MAKTFWLVSAGVAAAVLWLGCKPSYGPPLLTECKFDKTIAVNVQVYESEAALKKRLQELRPSERLASQDVVKGFATMSTVTGIHTLHVPMLRGQTDRDRIETLGHELAHSFCGEWHG